MMRDNADNTLSSISFSGASIGNLTYAWDDNKNKTAETIGGTMSGYGFSVGSSGYDHEDRLINYNRADGNLDQSWNLSSVGDWNSVTTDFDNRLNTADVGNNSSIDVTYKFDALGRRVMRDDGSTAVVYVQAGQQTIADYPSAAAASSPSTNSCE